MSSYKQRGGCVVFPVKIFNIVFAQRDHDDLDYTNFYILAHTIPSNFFSTNILSHFMMKFEKNYARQKNLAQCDVQELDSKKFTPL